MHSTRLPFRQAPRTVEPTVLHLNKGMTHWIAKPLGRRVTCDEGTLWLCFDGELQDIVLEPGEVHDCEKRSTLSIHALSAGVARVSATLPQVPTLAAFNSGEAGPLMESSPAQAISAGPNLSMR